VIDDGVIDRLSDPWPGEDRFQHNRTTQEIGKLKSANSDGWNQSIPEGVFINNFRFRKPEFISSSMLERVNRVV
jgi:hypothetical protein